MEDYNGRRSRRPHCSDPDFHRANIKTVVVDPELDGFRGHEVPLTDFMALADDLKSDADVPTAGTYLAGRAQQKSPAAPRSATGGTHLRAGNNCPIKHSLQRNAKPRQHLITSGNRGLEAALGLYRP
jgi:hypothetical protein